MTTASQRRANRLNAQRSTGPKTAQGRQRVSQNAVRHGLSAPLETDPVLLEALVMRLQAGEGLFRVEAESLALRIIAFERTQAHQRTQWLATLGSNAPEDLGQDSERSSAVSVTQMLGNRLVKAEGQGNTHIAGQPLQWYKDALRLFIQSDRSAQRAGIREIRAADRYYRRAANQLIKALRGLDA